MLRGWQWRAQPPSNGVTLPDWPKSAIKFQTMQRPKYQLDDSRGTPFFINVRPFPFPARVSLPKIGRIKAILGMPSWENLEAVSVSNTPRERGR
jgi:hypothetical protein